MNSLMRRRVTRVLTQHARIARVLLAVGATALFAAACDVHGVSAPGTLATLVITPNPQTLAVGATQQFTAVGKDFAGVPIPVTPTWSVVSGGGSINASGLFTAGGVPGTYANTIKATSGSISATATVTVTIGPLATITVTPNPTTLAIGAPQQFVAVGKDAAGNVVQFTPTWSVVNGGGTVNAAGLFTAGSLIGTFMNTVQASSIGVVGTATVIVTAGPLAKITVTPNPVTLSPGATQQFTAVGTDAGGNVVGISPVWSVANGGGSINSASGVFTAAGAVGTYANTVKATSGTVSGTATVSIVAGALASITVTPAAVTLSNGMTQQFTATGADAGGNTVAITPVWSVVNGGGSINASGLFTASAPNGTYANTVMATSGGLSGTASVTVVAGPAANIVVTPNPVTLTPGATQQFTATATDANGNAVVIAPTWTIQNGGGSINASGLFTAGTVAGTFNNTVKASSGTVSGTATVIVSAGPLANIVVSPNPVTLAPGFTQQFTAVGTDANGNPVTITPVWSVVNGGGTINAATGVFTAGAAGGTFTNTVRATVGATFGSATVTVIVAPPPTLATITVTPNPATVLTNGTQQFTAVGRDASGNVIVINPVWTVVNGGGTIAANGLFTAGAVVGTFNNTVQATSGAISGNATVNVTAVAPAPLINLGTAAPNGIMAGQAVTCISGGLISADISISPGNTLTGFGPCVATGVKHLGDAVAQQGQLDLTTAYNQLASLPCPPANAIVADLGGTTKPAGVYCTASGIGITGILTLDGGGDPNANFVFQAGTTLTTAGSILLIGQAQAKNVYFQVGTSATLGTASQIKGNILALTSITLVDNATLLGRALARNGSVTLGTNNVITLP
ncbi:hypothetical protein BH11GEM1_BH11GEM1_06280 [soil metagenome]